ncbi:MAG: hypothetical protein PHQ54_02525, partial [Candidatus Omnitrophica bacterium]|nr:hypothetical protein [Candidatus Omnitrophota bacterium]
DIDVRADSAGDGYHRANVYLGTPVSSVSGNVNITAQADDYAEIDIENYYYNYTYNHRDYYNPQGWSGSYGYYDDANGEIRTTSGNIDINATATEGSEAYIYVYGPVSSRDGNINITAVGSDESGIEIFGGTQESHWGYGSDYRYDSDWWKGYYWYQYEYWQTYQYGGSVATESGNISVSSTSDNNAYIDVLGPVSSVSGTIGMTAQGSHINVLGGVAQSDSYYNNYPDMSSSYHYDFSENTRYYAGSVDNGSGNINLTATPRGEDTSSIEVSGTVSTDTGNINMAADDYIIGGDTIVSYDGGDITLANATAGRAIAIGYQTDNDDMEIDDDEIVLIITDGKITIGSATAGPVVIDTATFEGPGGLYILSNDDILVHSIDVPNCGLYLETANGSIYSGDGWELTGPNVIARGASYFAASQGMIGVGTQDDITEYNPLFVCIQDYQGNSAALPQGFSAQAALTLLIGASSEPDYIIDVADGFGPLGVSGALMGLVRGGVIAATGVYPSPDIDLANTPTGYIFYDDTTAGHCDVLTGPAATNADASTSYALANKIYPATALSTGAIDTGVNQLIAGTGSYFDWPVQELLGFFRVYPGSSGAVSVYFYHPLISADFSAFEGFQLPEDMYEFIEGRLRLKEGDFFSWLEEELKK